MEDIFNGKIKHIPTSNLDKQTAIYQLLHYFRNKNIKEDNRNKNSNNTLIK